MSAPEGKPVDMKQVMELISARLSAGADDYSIASEIEPLGVAPERIPSLISMVRRRLGIAAPVAAAPARFAAAPAGFAPAPAGYAPPAYSAASSTG